ncbi:hypothetical protein OSB04_005782 [Centaurea solstitialis]|uniref:Uncharacterized protein n=1 Tax=Centaurea solstitialis TaxID=347529 RepID=A0AA38TZU8_9ASTR|nr:hypothetical protein OSB04_005782 [Centaurea solstitialis]
MQQHQRTYNGSGFEKSDGDSLRPLQSKIWELNVSVFLHFKELRSLNLSSDFLDNGIENTEFAAMENLQILDLTDNRFYGTFEMHGLESLSGLRKLEILNLGYNSFNEEIFPSLSALPSLKVLILKANLFLESFPAKGLAYVSHLEVLDLSYNNLGGSIPSSIQALSSLKVLSLARNESQWLFTPSCTKTDLSIFFYFSGFCELQNLHELDLSDNNFEGEFPPCFNSSSPLKLFDISLNQFSGNISSLPISNVTSLEYIDLSHNKFEGLFSMSSLFNHTKLEVVEFISDNDKFEVETEEPLGWMPMFQLKVLVLSNCNLNKGSRIVPSFLLQQYKLHMVSLSHNSLNGTFPNWLIENNTKLEYVNLKNNSFGGTIRMPPYQNVNTWHLDVSANHLTGIIPSHLGNILPYIIHLNLSQNALHGALPRSMGNLSELEVLDLSDNKFSGEVPKRWLSGHCRRLFVLQLSNNKLDGEVLSENLNASRLTVLSLDNNLFTGVLPNEIIDGGTLNRLDISGNFFSGVLPPWIGNLTSSLLIRNNMFQGQFPCGTALFLFLDISQNNFSGPVPFCPNMQIIAHLHLDSNGFTGSIPKSFRNLTYLLTLDMGNNKLSSRIPNFLGELSKLRILFLRKNNFTGSIPKQLCQLSNLNLMDLSSNSLSGSIPNCLQNITGPSYLAFRKDPIFTNPRFSFYKYGSVLVRDFNIHEHDDVYGIQDEVKFTTKSRPDTYKGRILNYMSGIDLSCNNLTGEIPKELGLLSHILAMNLSHNQLTGPIPSVFSHLENIESLDISSNRLNGRVPSELLVLHNLAVFIVANNNLSGRLPEMKGQFGTFNVDSYVGNPFLCGPPLEKNCTRNSTLMTPPLSADEKWYFMDMVSFGASLVSAWFVFLMGFAGVLYVNPYWRRRWLDFVEELDQWLWKNGVWTTKKEFDSLKEKFREPSMSPATSRVCKHGPIELEEHGQNDNTPPFHFPVTLRSSSPVTLWSSSPATSDDSFLNKRPMSQIKI